MSAIQSRERRLEEGDKQLAAVKLEDLLLAVFIC